MSMEIYQKNYKIIIVLLTKDNFIFLIIDKKVLNKEIANIYILKQVKNNEEEYKNEIPVKKRVKTGKMK